MAKQRAWVDLSADDIRGMLISLVGFRFGKEPEKHLDEIRAERGDYMQKFVRLAAVKPTDHVLELGSGCGFGTRALAGKAGRVTACDISPAYLTYASAELQDIDNLELHLVDNRDLSIIPARSIDKVISTSVFIHLNLYDIYLYLKEFHRIMKPRGKLVFDFADEGRLGGLLKRGNLVAQFREHVEFYAQDPTAVAGLVQWNSAQGITSVARLAGFRRLRRRGHRLLFQRNGA